MKFLLNFLFKSTVFKLTFKKSNLCFVASSYRCISVRLSTSPPLSAKIKFKSLFWPILTSQSKIKTCNSRADLTTTYKIFYYLSLVLFRNLVIEYQEVLKVFVRKVLRFLQFVEIIMNGNILSF